MADLEHGVARTKALDDQADNGAAQAQLIKDLGL